MTIQRIFSNKRTFLEASLLILALSAVLFLLMPSSAFALCNDDNAVPASGNYTVSSNCTFSGASGVGGVDNGNMTIGSGSTLTINDSETVVWNSGFSITVDGTITKSASGAELRKTNLWMLDSDTDNYPASSTQTAQDGSPGAGYRRRNVVTNYTTVDANDSDATCYRDRYPTTGGTITSCVADTDCVADEAGYQDTSAVFFTVFVTSTTSNGNQTSTATLDANCDTLAGSGSYTAWVSSSATDEPRDRGLSSCATAGSNSVAWYLPDGTTKIADNWADLTDNTIDVAISQDESQASCSTDVWTGTNEDGSTDGSDCVDWTSTASNKSARTGDCSATNGTWSDKSGGATKCNNTRKKSYCFQDAS